jgi:hypothetical protein
LYSLSPSSLSNSPNMARECTGAVRREISDTAHGFPRTAFCENAAIADLAD